MKNFSFILFVLAVSTGILAQQPNLSPLEAFLQNPALQNANVGVCIKDMKTGKMIAESRSAFVISPASTQKLLTTTTALELLGSDFRFSTYLETDSTITNGTLNGNLYIRGTGDPTLGSQKIGDQMFLYRWIQALRKKGINKIAGNIIADATFFDGDAVNPQWIWEDIGNYYAAGVYALPYLDNTLNIQLSSTAIGQVADVIKTLPAIEGIEFENHIRCTSITYDGAFVHGLPYNNKRYLVGSIPANHGVFGVKGDIPNPPLLLAEHLKMRLEEQGIIVEGKADYITEGIQQNRALLYEYRSEPLSEIIKETNVNSNNLYAEQLFRYLASRITLPCTIQNSVIVMQNCWRNRGVNLQNSFIMDGCGLAPQDAISAGTLVQILSFMNKSKNKDAFVESLPVAGETGTLRGFLRNTPLQGNVCAKSGTTSRIKSYAGYMTSAKGEPIAFAVIVNNAACKSRQVQTMIEQLLIDVYQKY